MSPVKAKCSRVVFRNDIEEAGAVGGEIGGLKSASAIMFADRAVRFATLEGHLAAQAQANGGQIMY